MWFVKRHIGACVRMVATRASLTPPLRPPAVSLPRVRRQELPLRPRVGGRAERGERDHPLGV